MTESDVDDYALMSSLTLLWTIPGKKKRLWTVKLKCPCSFQINKQSQVVTIFAMYYMGKRATLVALHIVE